MEDFTAVSFCFPDRVQPGKQNPFLSRGNTGRCWRTKKRKETAEVTHREPWQKAGHRERQEEVSSWNLEIQRRSLRSCTQTRGGLAWTLEDSEESAHKAGMQAPEEGGHSFGARGRVPMGLGLRPVR